MTPSRIPRQSIRRHAASFRAPAFGGPRLACEVVRDQGFALLSRTILDLSETGMCVALDAAAIAPRVGEAVWASFRAVHLGMWFDFEAEIARVLHGRRPTDRGAAIGLRFVTRWDAGRASTPALSRLLVKNGIARLPALVAPSALRGARGRSPWAASVSPASVP